MNTKLIKRNIYLDKILPFIDKNLIKVIVGQRRVGKSYMLYQITDYIKTNNSKANIIYINKERYEFDAIKNYSDLIEYCQSKLKPGKKNYLLIDEIQDIENFEKALRHFYSEPNIDIYCTGSNAKLLSGELADLLSGRYIEIKMYGLSWPEFLEFHKMENTIESLNKYLEIGGLPYIINLSPEKEVIFEYLRNIFSAIIYKDIIARYKIRNHHFLENLVKYLANNTGNLISAKKISDYLRSQNIKMSPQIVLDYLSYLENAFLIFKVKRSDLFGKKLFETNEKYYFEDLGLKNAITGENNIQINQVIENVIFNHLKIAGYEVQVGISGNKEVDFIANRQGKKKYIQAAYLLPDEKVIKREFGNLLEIKDNYKKMVVSLDQYAPKNVQGIEHIHLIDFLSNTNI
jgi:uncharacterized protein